MAKNKNIRIGRIISGFMCTRTEPYPWGEGECIPLFGPVEQLPEEPIFKEQSLAERMKEAIKEVEKMHNDRMIDNQW